MSHLTTRSSGNSISAISSSAIVKPELLQALKHFELKDYPTACRLATEHTPNLINLNSQNLNEVIFGLDLQISCYLQQDNNQAAKMTSNKLIEIINGQLENTEALDYKISIEKRHIEILLLTRDISKLGRHVDATLALYEQVGNTNARIANNFQLAELLRSNGQLTESVKVALFALNRLDEGPYHAHYRIAFHNLLADSYESQGNLGKAIEHADIACEELQSATAEERPKLMQLSATTPITTHLQLVKLCCNAFIHGAEEYEQKIFLAINSIKKTYGEHSNLYIEALWQYAIALNKSGHASQAEKVANIAQSLNFKNLTNALSEHDSVSRDTLLVLEEDTSTIRNTLSYYEGMLPQDLKQSYAKSLLQIAQGIYNKFAVTGKDAGLEQAFAILDIFTSHSDHKSRIFNHHKHARCLVKLGQFDEALRCYEYAIRHSPKLSEKTVIFLLESAELLTKLKVEQNQPIDWEVIARKIDIACKIANTLDPKQKNIVSAKCLTAHAKLKQLLYTNLPEDKAFEYYQENIADLKLALKIYEDLRHQKTKDFSTIYKLLGKAYSEIGDEKNSLHYFGLANSLTIN